MTLVDSAPTGQLVPPKSGKIDAGRVREQYRKGTDDLRRAQQNYRINAAFIDLPDNGSQWTYWHAGSNQLIQMPRDPRRVQATIARIGPESRRIMAKLLKRPLVFEVPPDAPDTATLRAARTAEAVVTHLADDQKWGRLREELAWGLWKGGTAALCLDWDATAGDSLGFDPVTLRPVGTGDVRVTALSITKIATEPGTQDIERANWWIKAEVLPPAEVKKLYRMKTDPVADANTTSMPIRPANGSTRPSQLTLVLTYYERPNPDNKTGTVAVVVGQEVVDGPHPWPFPFTDRLNVVCARETLIEGQWFGKTVVTDCIPMQTALNHAWTSALEHLKQAGNARLQNSILERESGETLSDTPGDPVYFQDTPWTFLAPPSMPDWWQRVPERLQMAMDDALGVHDVTRGQAPSNIESGLGLSILAEQDDTPTGKLSQTLADAFGDLATLVLKTYEAKVQPPEQRTARITGPITEKVTWDGTAFMGQCYAKVPYDAVAPMNETARFARAMQLIDRQVIQDPVQVSAYIDVAGMGSSFIETINPQVAKARSENHRIMFGEACVPATWDNHAVHIAEHNNERLSARYERAADDIQQLMDLHIQAHSTLAAEEMANQMLKLQHAPGLAEAAQGDQPPGSAVPPAGPIAPQAATMGALTGGNPQPQGSPAEASPNP